MPEMEINNKDIEIIKALMEKYPQSKIVLALPEYSPQLEQFCVEQGLPHYYQEQISTIDRFNGFLSLDVTDIFIANELGFSLNRIKPKAEHYGKALRCYCNVCESSWWEDVDHCSLKTFFIRPEDIDLYSNYIDTFEFYLPDDNVPRINTLYEIYAQKKRWFGRYDELIFGYDGEEDGRYMIPDFGIRRLYCGKECAYVADSVPSCHICDRISELCKTLKDHDLIVKVEKS